MRSNDIKKEIPLIEKELTGQIIAAGIEVHRALGPGLLESVYYACLAHELLLRQIPYSGVDTRHHPESIIKILRATVAPWFAFLSE